LSSFERALDVVVPQIVGYDIPVSPKLYTVSFLGREMPKKRIKPEFLIIMRITDEHASARILIEVTGWQRFTVNGYRPRDEDVYVSYGLPGRQVARFPMRDDQTMFLFVFADAKGRCLEQPGIDHKDILRAEFGEAGWECPQILD
jgi:hypothetical protein